MIKKNRQIKEAKVLEIKEKLEKAQGVVLADYQGLSVEEDTMLRKSLREAGVEYKVYKNSLVTRAANELGLGDVVQYLEGPVSIAFGYEDATAPARVLNNFAKDHKKLELKQINKCSLLFSADARSKFDLKDVPSEEIITIFVSEMAVSSMTSSVFSTGFRVEMDVPKARILHTQICKNIPMRAYYFDQKTHRRVSTSF